ncbi:MAG: hypothetical protein V7607_1964 [Solirubrobacteraceae bacterium]
MTYRCLTRGPLEVHAGGGLGEPRQVWEVAEASLEGDGIRATLAAPGADWMRVSADGFWRPDVRLALRTEDGAALTLSYTGLVEQTEAFVAAATEDRETTWDQQYMRMVLRFETGDDRYAWLTRSIFVAQGRILGTGRVEYAVFRVT